MQCPVNYSSGGTVTANGWANNVNSMIVQLCYNPAGGGASVCGNEKFSSTTGLQSLSPPLPSGGIPSGAYVYLNVILVNDSSTWWGYTDNGP